MGRRLLAAGLLIPGILVGRVSGSAAEAPLPDTRPAFDKTAYRGTVWSAANPWWPPNKSRTYAGGGPDFAWHRYPDDPVAMWKEVALRCQPYGLTGLQGEVLLPDGYISTWKAMAEGFRQAGNGFFLQAFLTGAEPTDKLLTMFAALMPELKEHPNVYRLDGHPVVVLYSPSGTPSEWREAIARVEARYGRMIWLIDGAFATPEWLRQYLPVVDGISMYANWSDQSQRELYARITDVMHREFPTKVFEGAVHTTYFVHFHYGGVQPALTEKYRRSWEITLAARPDSLTLTNFFDCYENSRVLPSYELDDVLLRIARHQIDLWKGRQPGESDTPELYVSNHTNVLLGQPLRFEVLGFPLKGPNKEVTVRLEVCDEEEKVLHAFPERQMLLDGLKVETFTLPSDRFLDRRAVHPRVTYRWHGGQFQSYPLPQTNLVTSLRPHVLFWCRALDHQIRIDTSRRWTLNGVGPGGTVTYPPDGVGVIAAEAFSQGMPGVANRGGGWVRILRNGRELQSLENWDLRFVWPIRLPHPGGALDWYQLELENGSGARYLSTPIWVKSDRRPGTVSLPIWPAEGPIREVTVEAARVPFFYYPCDRPTGRLLLDTSGYDHHGYLGGSGYGGGHLAYTAYRHEHVGLVAPTEDAEPRWVRDSDGRGCLRFDGNSYVMIQGGTAFPYASTYELSLKPERTGKRMGVLGAAGGQVNLYLTENGRMEASRGGTDAQGAPTTARVLSRAPLPAGRWSHVAVVYDLKELSLYVNGVLQGRAPLGPTRTTEEINAVVVGGTCGFPFNPRDYFTGSIRQVRIYGRNLAPREFLGDDAPGERAR